ncbi:Ig-like domain-containing protein, partial [Neomoorella thermoacetica]|uniref:Ig-like domain-containing protein n=1 Tax=Neomoorella thermoacetica TaxID=1525 RepID=UPI000A3E9BEF
MRKTMRYQSALLVLIFVFTLLVPGFALAQEQPVLPAAYYGTVTLNGQPAPIGTIIVARIGGEVRGQITVENVGEYGGPGDPLALKLKVNGTMEDEGKPVTFEVAGIQASETVAFKVGDVKQVNLTATGTPPGTVDTTPPTVESTDPADNEINIPVTKEIIVTFSEHVQAGAAYDAISVKDAAGNAVAVNTSIEGNILNVKPSTSLAYNTKYTVAIPAGAVKDAAGNNLAQAYVFSFTTSQAASKVEISVPSNGKLDNFTMPPGASSVVLNQGGAQMEIPQGAFSGAAAITFKPVDNTGLPGASSIGQVFEIKIEKVTLSQPVTLRLPAPAGERVRVFKLVGDRWVNLGGTVSGGYVEVSQKSFSLFAAANAPAPPTASPEPGSYTGSVQVTLSAETGATILYGLNAPPQTTYKTPITLTSSGTIRSVAVKDALTSDEVNFAYTVTASTGGGGGGSSYGVGKVHF